MPHRTRKYACPSPSRAIATILTTHWSTLAPLALQSSSLASETTTTFRAALFFDIGGLRSDEGRGREVVRRFAHHGGVQRRTWRGRSGAAAIKSDEKKEEKTIRPYGVYGVGSEVAI